MAPKIAVEPVVLLALADELAGLAVALATDGNHCRAAAGALDTALGGWEGATAGAVATTWGTLAGALAESTEAVAGTLRAAVLAYRGADGELAGRIGTPAEQPGAGSC